MSRGLKIGFIVGGIVLIILIVLPMIFGGFSGWGNRYYGMMSPGIMGGFGWWWFMPIFMIIFWGLIIWGIVALIRRASSSSGQADSALEVLKRRYAKGEINKEEFEQKKKDLS